MDLRISAELWKPLSDFDKGKIEGIMLASKVMEHGDKIIPDESIPASATKDVKTFGLGIPILDDAVKAACQAACAAAAASAAGSCSGLAPVAAAACYALAGAAHEECRRRC